MEKLYIGRKNKPRADHGSNHDLLIKKFRLKLKKVGETTRLFRYDIIQFLYYTVEVISKFKEVDLIDRVPDEIHKIVPDAMTKTIPKEKEMQESKVVVLETLQISMKIREVKGKREGKDIPN